MGRTERSEGGPRVSTRPAWASPVCDRLRPTLRRPCFPLGDPIEIRVGNSRLTLRKAEAAGIAVHLTDSGG